MAGDIVKGRGGKNNFGTSNKTALAKDSAFVGKLVKEVYVAYKQPKVNSNAELAERLDKYFKYCAENNIVPTVEEMCLYTGYSIQTVWDWEKGRTHPFDEGELNVSTSEIIKNAKSFMRAFDAKLVQAGKLNPVTYIFRAKNYYGMTDKQEVEVTKTNQLGDNMTDDELAKKLMKATEVIDVEASETEE